MRSAFPGIAAERCFPAGTGSENTKEASIKPLLITIIVVAA